MNWHLALAAAALSALCSLAATRGIAAVLRRRAILDHPTARSSHSLPTPRGGGIAVVGTAALVWAGAGLAGGLAWPHLAVLAPALLLAALSWRDDLGGLPVAVRFAAQAAAVGAGMLLLPVPVVPWLALPLAVAWLWFVNLFNFMDGIDGIAGAESVVIATGVAGIALLAGAGDLALPAAALGGAALGFLRWNWAPARIFLGDVGSIPLGYLFGWLLICLALSGFWASALILPLYYLADASLTLARRLLRGERVWQAHRSHYYQQAARRWHSHARVSGWIGGTGAALAALALDAARMPERPWTQLALASGLTAAILYLFADKADTAHPA